MAAVNNRKSRKPLKALSSNDVNISAGKPSLIKKENREDVSLPMSPPKKFKKAVSKPKASEKNQLAHELQEMQERFEELRLEKEKMELLLKQREEELENREKEQEKFQREIKKLQKLKEFKPTVSFPLGKSLRQKEEEKQDKKNKKKKSKDGSEKKKPCSAYSSWCKDQWNEVKKENPEADFKEISNMLGAKWKNLSAEEKKPYKERYQQEKDEYLKIVGQEKRENEAMKLLEEEQLQKTAMELLEQYLQFKQQEADDEGIQGKKKTKKEKDPLKPKQPMSAFFLYSNKRRAALIEANKNVLEIAKIAGEEWKNMTEQQRAPYEEIAKQQKEEYNKQMLIYKQKKIEEAANMEKEQDEQKKVMKQEALQLLKKKEKTENIIKKTRESRQKKKKEKGEKNSDPNKPKKPASSFLLFSKETRKSLLEKQPGINNSTLSAMISVKWKELSEDEKKFWNDKAAEGLAAYKTELEEYNKTIAMATGSNSVPNSDH